MTTNSRPQRAQKHKQFFTALTISFLTALLAIPATFPTATADNPTNPTPTATPNTDPLSTDSSDSELLTDLSFHWITPINGDTIDGDHLVLREDGQTTTPARLEFRLLDPLNISEYPIGAVTVEVPFGVWKKRLGEITGGVTIEGIPVEGSVPSGSTDWVYRIDPDTKTLAITNNRVFNAKGHAVLTFNFQVSNTSSNAQLIEYKDGTPSEPLSATVTLTSPSIAGGSATYTSNEITAEINTTAKAWLTSGPNTCQKQANNDLLCPLRIGTSDYGNNQPYTWDNLDISMPGSGAYDVLVKYPHATIDHIESANPNAEFDIATDGHSAIVRYPDDRCDKHDVTVWVRVPAKDYPYNASEINVGFSINASSWVYPGDELDPEYQKFTSPSGHYHYQATEELDTRFSMPFFSGSKNSYNPFVIDGTGKEKWLADDLDEGKDIEWRTWLATQLKQTEVLTRGTFPTLESFEKSGDRWTATVTNTGTITSRLANIEIPLPDGVEINEESLSFTLDGEEKTTSYVYDEENGVLIIQTPNIPAGKKFTTSFTLTDSSNVSNSAGTLDVKHSGYHIDPIPNTSNKVQRTDIFTVTNNGTSPSPAGIPLELNRIGCNTPSSPLACFEPNYTTYSPTNLRSETSVRFYSHTVYLPALQPGETFTYEVTSTRITHDTAENEHTDTAFRTKLGHSTQNSSVKQGDTSPFLYAFISDLQKDNNKNYGWRSLTVETTDPKVVLTAPESRTLIPGDDFDITGIAFLNGTNSTGSSNSLEIWGTKPDGTTATMWNGYLDVWGRASESESWTKYARVHFSDHGKNGIYSTPIYDHIEFFGVEGVGEIAKADNEGVRISVPEGTAQTRVTYSSTDGIRNMETYYYNIIRLNHDGTNLRDVMDKNPTKDLTVRNYRSARYWYTDETTDITSSTPSDHILATDTGGYNIQTSTTLERVPEFKTKEEYQFYYSDAQFGGTYSVDNRYFTINNTISTNSSLSGFGSSCVYAEKIASGEWKHMTHAKFYSLQPMGVRVDKDSVTLTQYLNGQSGWKDSPGDIVDVQIVENWRGTGRQMLIVEVDNLAEYTPTPDCNRDTTSSNASYIDSARITFTSYYSAVDYMVYKSSLNRVDAVENLSDTTIGYDSTNAKYTSGYANPPANWANDIFQNFTTSTDAKFMYAIRNTSVNYPLQFFSDFRKFVATSGSPTFGKEAWVSPDEEYAYRLLYQNDSPLDKKELVFFDSIETFQPPDEPERAHFRGHFRGLNLASLRFQGVEPVVYYSTIPELDVTVHQDLDEEINGEPIWRRVDDVDTFDGVDMDAVTAFAVDCSKKPSGDDFYLQQDDYLIVDVYMQAPTREEARAAGNLTVENPVAYVYNDSYMKAVEVNTDGSVAGRVTDQAIWTALRLHDPTIVLEAGKALTGRNLEAGQFTFGVYDEGGALIAEGTNDADGIIKFSPITYTSADIGTHNYTMREIGGQLCTQYPDAYTCDSTEYAITVDVVAAGESVTAIATYPTGTASSDISPYIENLTQLVEQAPVFVNDYTSSGESVPIVARKEVDAAGIGATVPALRDGQFSFALYDSDGTIVALAENAADGSIDFGTIAYTHNDIDPETGTGRYTYTMRETSCEAFWVCDSHTETVTVDLVDDGRGNITATVTYDNGEAVFENTYSEPPATWLENAAQHNWIITAFAICGLIAGVSATYIRRQRG